MTVRELTGDMQLSKNELEETQRLVSTQIELDGRACTPKWNWMRCEKNWQLMPYNDFLIELHIPPSFYMSF
ncbi:unnamed protein product [Prunus brigantina]